MTTITTAYDFISWLTGGSGRICVYHTGNLAEACEADAVPSPAGRIARDLANAVWSAAVAHRVYLFRRTLRGENNARSVEYIAIRPRDGKVPRRFAPDGEVYSWAADAPARGALG